MPTAAEYRQTLLLAVPIEEASAKVRTGPPKDDDDDIELPIWAGVLPLATRPGDPEPDPRARAGDSTSLPPSPGTTDPAGSELARPSRVRGSATATARCRAPRGSSSPARSCSGSGASSSRSSRST